MIREQWIKNLPSTWSITRLGALGSLSKGSGGSKEDNRDSGVAVVRYGELYGKFDQIIREARSFISPDDASRYTPLPTGSLVFAGSGEDPEEIGKSALSLIPAPAFVGGDTVIFSPRPNAVDPIYLTYVLDSKPLKAYKAVRSTGITVVHISAGKLKTLPIPLPPFDEQRAIADYLDHETAQIDALVAKQEELIRLLRERREVTISALVTSRVARSSRALPLRASGVSWIGDVPANWKVLPVRSLVYERRDRNAGGDTRYLSLVANIGIIPYEEKGDIGNKKPEDLSKCKIVHAGDFVINSMNYQIGSYGLSRLDGVCSPVYIVMVARPGMDRNFFARVFESRPFQRLAQSFGQGILDHRRAIGWSELKNLKVPVPPLEEQRAIADYLNHQTAQIDTLIAKAEEHIALAKERRSALITAAVTGQFDVRTARKAG